MASASVRAALQVENTIPSKEYTQYLTDTTLYHLGPLYHVVDEHSFKQQVDHFYAEGQDAQTLTSLWHVQFLLVIAFGKLFLRRGGSCLGPPGANDFLRSLKLQSDVLDICNQPILRIEVLCLISLYLWISDMKTTAYVFV